MNSEEKCKSNDIFNAIQDGKRQFNTIHQKNKRKSLYFESEKSCENFRVITFKDSKFEIPLKQQKCFDKNF